jgi:mRNA-degrading endonuclease YafQ of YafQ-DinJ toxin-antitoxin module
MTIVEIIGVLELIKTREIKHNAKINNLCTNPTDSIGARAIDAAIYQLTYLQAENAELRTTSENWKKDFKNELQFGRNLMSEIAELMARLESAVELPVKYGDLVYMIKGNEITHNHVKQIHISQTHEQTILSFEGDRCLIGALGKTVFLTREEAETALNARRTEENA